MANEQTAQTQDPMLAAVHARQAQQSGASSAATAWSPSPDDPVTHIQVGDQQFHIHSDDLPEAQRRNPSLKVIGQVNDDPMLAAVKARKGAKDDSVAAAPPQQASGDEWRERTLL